MQHIKKLIVIFLSFCLYHVAFADPWFTGPILAPAGHTIPRGHTNVELYGLDVLTNGSYDPNGNVIHTPLFRSLVANPVMSHGFTDWMDVQLTLPYVRNSTLGVSGHRLADVSAALGIQLLEQKGSTWKPDLRFVFQETFPTGRFDHLNPAALGTDATGLGSYQSQLALNFQYLAEVFKTHYLRTRLSLSRTYYSPITVHGFNSFGGTATTIGKVTNGLENLADLAFEYTLTQHWVAVMEGYLSQGEATRFNGIINIGALGGPITISGPFIEDALAPALEYNFNANVGLIGGVWFPVYGKNTSHYTTYVLALNAYW